MKPNEFDPRNLDPNANLSDDERMALLQREEDERKLQEGDANEAAGLNRDGSPKSVPLTPPVMSKAPENTQGPASSNEPEEINLGTGMRDAPAGDTSTSSESMKVKAILAKQPKLPVFLALETGERKGSAYRSVTINGYRFEVKKGMMVYVPEAVHDILINAMQATADATEVDENLSNADGGKRSALALD